MISLSLQCSGDHRFDVWFRNGEDCDQQLDRQLVACPECGSTMVQKALMAPTVKVRNTRVDMDPHAALRSYMREVERKTVDVGDRFAKEARDMEEGKSEQRAIRGTATEQEIRQLVEDGIQFTTLPALPKDN